MSITNDDLAHTYALADILLDLRKAAMIERGRAALYDAESDTHEVNSNSMHSAIIASLEHKHKAEILDKICEALLAGDILK